MNNTTTTQHNRQALAHIRELEATLDSVRSLNASTARQLACLQTALETVSEQSEEASVVIQQVVNLAGDLYTQAVAAASEIEHVTEEDLQHG